MLGSEEIYSFTYDFGYDGLLSPYKDEENHIVVGTDLATIYDVPILTNDGTGHTLLRLYKIDVVDKNYNSIDMNEKEAKEQTTLLAKAVVQDLD